MLTPYQIAEQTDHLDGTENIAAINKLFRSQDDSHLWPINGAFNATERAIRRVRRAMSEGLDIAGGLEYALAVESEISDIVNSQ